MDKTRLRQVIQTRITPPKAPKNIIARSGITKVLLSSEDRKLLLLTAPAGYGKTTIVTEFINSSGRMTAWVQVTADMKSVFDLIEYLVSSLRKINLQFGNSLLETIEMAENDSIRIKDHQALLTELAGIMINDMLNTFTEKILIVLDDLHELQDSENTFEFLDLLIRDLPVNVQLLIVSRQLPKLSLTHLRAKRQLREITQKELMFNKEEISSLAGTVYGISLSEESIEYLLSSLGGWVTGLHLVMQSFDENEVRGEVYLKSIPANIFDYFAEEIFNRMDSSVKDFLLRTSHLESFDLDACNRILQISNGNEFLDLLLNRNIFLESKHFIHSDGRNVTNYSYIQLFKVFLYTKSLELLSDEVRNELMYRSCLYYKSVSEIEKAIDYCALANKPEHLEILIKEYFEEFFLNGRFEKLWKWIDSFDESSLKLKKDLLYYKGILHKFYHGDLDKSLDYINKSIELSGKEKDEDFTIKATISRLGILLNQGKTSDAMKELLALEKKKTSETNRARVFYYLANVYFFNNELETSLKYANLALDLCKTIENSSITEDIYNLLGNLNIIRGEFVHSIHYYELTLSMTKSLQRKLVVLGNLSILYSRSGKYCLAKDYYDETLKLVRYFSSPIFDLLVKMTEYTLIFETGDYIPAIALAEEINRMSLKIKNSQYIYLSYQFLGECSFYLGRKESASNYFDLAEKYINRSTESDSILISLLKTINSLDTAPAAETEKELCRVNEFLSSIDSYYDKTIAGFYTAKFYFNNGNPETCIEYLDKVLLVSKEKGYFSFLLREFMRSSGIFSLLKNRFKETTGDWLASIHEISELEWISNEYRDQLQKLIDRQYDLKMMAFGGLRFIMHGEEIQDKKWVRKNRKLILCYLMLSHNKSLSKDKIIDIFYGDTPIDSADNTFHQAVSNLRTALKTQSKDIDAGLAIKNPDFITYMDKTLRLNDEFNYYSDLEDFDRTIIKAGSVQDLQKRIEYLIKAVNLYSGDVLEGYYDPWCESLREEYRNKFVKNTEILLETLAAQNKMEEVIRYAEKLNHTDPINYISFKYQIIAYSKLGKLNLAVNKYERYIAVYEEEMGRKPPQTELNELKGLTGE